MPTRKIDEVVAAAVPASVSHTRTRPPTLWEIAEEHPRFVRVLTNKEKPFDLVAVVTFPYNPEHVRMIKSCKGAYFDATTKTWHVPDWSARKLSEVLFIIDKGRR